MVGGNLVVNVRKHRAPKGALRRNWSNRLLVNLVGPESNERQKVHYDPFSPFAFAFNKNAKSENTERQKVH